MFKELELSKDIKKKELGNGIVSYNFSKKVFFEKAWNELNIKARGLFVDTNTNTIVARSYNKFFNYEEHETTQRDVLEKNLVFPVYGYLKENGFLGIVSYNKYDDDLFIASKSTNQGSFKEWFKEILLKTLGDKRDAFKDYLRINNSSAIFECIDVDKDPHMIKYDKSKVVLLDVVVNSLDNHFFSYQNLNDIAKLFNLEHKKLVYVVNNFQELQEIFDKENQTDNFLHNYIEGFVFKDSNGFMFKYKTGFYKFWKKCRTARDRIIANKVLNPQVSDEEKKVIDFMKTIPIEELKNLSIIQIRDRFLGIKNDKSS